MSILGDRIKKEREDIGLTRENLAKKIGVSYSAIAMYEQGKREPNNELILKMCEEFGCTADYLMGKSNFKTEADESTHYLISFLNNSSFTATRNKLKENGFSDCEIKQIEHIFKNIATDFDPKELELKFKRFSQKFPKEKQKKLESIIDIHLETFGQYATEVVKSNNIEKTINNIKNSVEFVSNSNYRYYMCPVYGQISAGQPNWAEENIEGRIPIDVNLMDIVNPEEHFFLRVNGESMNKVIKNGAFALIHKQDSVENGEIAVVLVNGFDATIKKFTKQGNLIILEPQSSDESFETQVYDKNTSIKILGKYVGKMEINK